MKPASSADDRARAFARLLADALVDQHVGVDGKPDAEHDAGDAGQGERRAQQAQRAEGQHHVQRQRKIGEQSPRPVEHEHEGDDEPETDQARS